MSREIDETSAQCAACQSTELTPLTRFDPSEGFARVHFLRKSPGSGFFASPYEHITVDRARVCLACGHVMHFLGAKRRRELAEKIAGLSPVPEE